MATKDQIAAWKEAGEAVRRAREDQGDGGGRSEKEVKRLREAAAETAAVCADCFTPLPPDASVTLVDRWVEHIPARYNGIGTYIRACDRALPVPICLSCWLIRIATPWWSPIRGVRQDAPLDRAGPEEYPDKVRRLRCEGCARPMRIHTKAGRRLPLHERCCCAACLRQAKRARNNVRRRVHHAERPCIVCDAMFIPKQSTAKTCSNTCRQRLFRHKAAEARRT